MFNPNPYPPPKLSVYGAYREIPCDSYNDKTVKDYVKFFETELDCLRFCVDEGYKCDKILLEPSSDFNTYTAIRGEKL